MSLSLQFISMIAMTCCGIYIGMAVDTFYRVHMRKKRSVFFRYANEILFWLLQGLIIFYVLFLINQGQIRFYILLAILFGFAFYQSVLRVWYLKGLEQIIRWLLALVRFIVRLFHNLIVKPITIILKTITYVLTLFWATVIWVILLLYRIIGKPILLLVKPVRRIIPKNVKKYLLSFANFYSKIKNTIITWWKRIFAKRR